MMDNIMPSSKNRKIKWYSDWHSEIDDALKVIPSHPFWPHEMLNTLFHASSGQKKIALISDHCTPIAVVALRSFDGEIFEPLAQTFSIPEFHVIGDINETADLLFSLNIKLKISWWKIPYALPNQSAREIKQIKVKTHYILDLSEEPDIYWGTSSLLKTVKRARKLSSAFTLRVNPPGGAEWITNSWGVRWNINQGNISDRTLAAQTLEVLGRHFTFIFYDGELPVAGNTFIIHRGEAIGLLTHCEENYRSYNLGNCLFDVVIHWAKDNGICFFDMGTTQDYKKKWAPESDKNWVLFEYTPQTTRIKKLFNLLGLH